MMSLAGISQFAQKNRWLWAAIGVLILWAVLGFSTNRFSISSLSGIALSASFLTILAIGQMFVVATGRGNIDLSIPAVVTLSAYIALIVIRGSDHNLAQGILATLALGVVVGLVNALLVVSLQIPAIIGTLATGYILATATLLANRIIPGFAVSPTIKFLAAGRLFGVPVMFLVALLIMGAASAVLSMSAFGRWLSAIGQNRTAARLAGIRVERVVVIAFLTSSVAASFTGLFLGAYIGGAFLEMGQPYLLQSIAAVVLGGTLIFGGYATALGSMLASILLILIVSTMQILGLPPGVQDVVQGIVVIAVLGVAGRELQVKRSARDDTESENDPTSEAQPKLDAAPVPDPTNRS